MPTVTTTTDQSKPAKLPREEDPRNPVHRLGALLDDGSLELITPDDDSGMLAALHTLAALAETDRPLSDVLAPYARYAASGEINSTVADPDAVLVELERLWAGEATEIDFLDGMTVTFRGGFFNVRRSNTEPLLRLNVEGPNQDAMERLRDEALAVIRG